MFYNALLLGVVLAVAFEALSLEIGFEKFNYTQLYAVDHLARESMKSAANCVN